MNGKRREAHMTTRLGFEKAAALAALLVLLRLPAGAQNAGGVDGDGAAPAPLSPAETREPYPSSEEISLSFGAEVNYVTLQRGVGIGGMLGAEYRFNELIAANVRMGASFPVSGVPRIMDTFGLEGEAAQLYGPFVGLEGGLALRFYFLRFQRWELFASGGIGLLATNIGEDLLLSRSSAEFEGRLGARIFLPENWYLEPYVRGGYPFVWGAGVMAGLRFPVNRGGPVLSLRARPDPFSPDGDGVDDILTMRLGVRSSAPIASWTVDILEPVEPFAVFKHFERKGRPPARLTWDGHGDNGELARATYDYPIIFKARDANGNAASVDGKVTVKIDVLIEKEGDNIRLHASAIAFSGNRTDFEALDEKTVEKNEWILKRVAELLKKRYSGYQVAVEGHANPVLGTEREEREMLGPISADRARFIMERLVALGVSGERLSSVGYGGTKPLVDWKDTDNRWKNRRVEFVLTKQGGKAGGEKGKGK
ncbi:MAG: OmpA family protein/gliding motility-associated C-terminal domain-containing protein [Treponematales bacterium]